MFLTFERIKELAKSRGITLGALEEKLGLSRNSIYTIKNKKPSAERLQLIADYFNVSTDYLLGRTDNPNIAKDDETIAGYTQDDLRKMAENAKTFDGKPLTEDDINAIQNIIEIYLRGRK
ncbi:MAG: helix-turn-helix transcriptional regulator [Streptococcus hyointestinalis]|nr:helix-turn-helix transcriptional regulator [Streptococcus hyointestinalis]MDD6385180.1 helix-turn-helix transcriptional regulator [Streptococcus hyointestinalis]